MAAFSRYIGIDYSGAETPESSLKGLRVYCAKSRRSETLEIALICRCKRYKLHEDQDHPSMSRSGPPPSPKGLGLAFSPGRPRRNSAGIARCGPLGARPFDEAAAGRRYPNAFSTPARIA